MDLKQKEALLEERLRMLSNAQRAELVRECNDQARIEGLEMSGKPMPFMPIPLLFGHAEYQDLSALLSSFLDALIRLEELSLTSSGRHVFQRLMNSLTSGGRHLVMQCSYESRASLARRMRRIDGYWDLQAKEYRLIEVNQAAPLGLHNTDALNRIGSRVLAAADLENTTPLLAPQILEWFRLEHADRKRDELPRHIALVIEHGYPGKFADLPRMAAAIEGLATTLWGVRLRISVCFPYDVFLVNGKPTVNNEAVDLVWRNTVYMTDYRQKGLAISDYETILSHPEDFVVINSTRSWLTRTKEALAIFWDDESCRSLGMTEKEQRVIRQVVPLTVNLKYSPGFRAQVKSERNEWISKPTDSGFGHGVEFGVNHTEKSWEALLCARADDGFVFQRRVSYSRRRVLAIEHDGGLAEQLVEIDFCPQQVAGKFSGTAVVRGNAVMNDGAAMPMNLSSGSVLFHAAFM